MVKLKHMNPCPRKSVGAIIQDKDSKYLCLYRKSYPPGLAFVAGHLDFIDNDKKTLEDPAKAIIREVKEEVGLMVLVVGACVLHRTFPNPCGKGYDSHEWYVYHIAEWAGEPKLMEPDKHEWVRFLTKEEIAEFMKRGEGDPAWSQHIWPASNFFFKW